MNSAAASQAMASPSVPGERVLGAFTAAYVFVLMSRVFDLFPGTHIPGILTAAVGVSVLGTGAIVTGFRSRTGRWLLFFTTALILSIPFGYWRYGSLVHISNHWFRSLLLFPAIAVLHRSPQASMKVAAALYWGGVLNAVNALYFGEMRAGRLFGFESRFADPNELALLLLTCCCFHIWRISDPSRALFGRAVSIGVMVVCGITAARTGSRGSAIALCLALAYLLYKSSWGTRIKAVAGATVAAVALVVFLPPHLLDRYATILGENSGTHDSSMDMGESSTESRLYLFKRSLALTAQNPIFGVGVGMFAVAENEMSLDEGLLRGSWHVTHNMYTQVSSEAGLLGLIAFLGTIIAMFRANAETQRILSSTNLASRRRLIGYSMALRYALILTCGGGLFLSIAYSDFLPLLGGLIVAMWAFARRTEASEARARDMPQIRRAPSPGEAEAVARANTATLRPRISS